jgi:hypothetical protein
VRRRAQEARQAARYLVKQSQQLRHDRDRLIREAEAARAPVRRATTTTQGSRSDCCCPTFRHPEFEDDAGDETGEREVASRTILCPKAAIIHTDVRNAAARHGRDQTFSGLKMRRPTV